MTAYTEYHDLLDLIKDLWSDLPVYLVWESLACQYAACSMHFSGMQKEPADLINVLS